MGIYTHTIYIGKYTSPMDGMGLDFFCASVILASSFLGGAKGVISSPKKIELISGIWGG